MATQKLKNIKFLLSPTGKYKLGYNAGETAKIPEAMAIEMVEDQYAEFVNKSDNKLLDKETK